MSEEIAGADALLRENADLRKAMAIMQDDHRRAPADAAALKEALEYRHNCENCGGRGTYYVDVEGEAESEVCDCWIRADHVLYHEEHPGTALLDELEAARKVVKAARDSYDVHDYPAEEGDLYKAIVAYDAAVKARGE